MIDSQPSLSPWAQILIYPVGAQVLYEGQLSFPFTWYHHDVLTLGQQLLQSRSCMAACNLVVKHGFVTHNGYLGRETS